jgi:hypothetical protein
LWISDSIKQQQCLEGEIVKKGLKPPWLHKNRHCVHASSNNVFGTHFEPLSLCLFLNFSAQSNGVMIGSKKGKYMANEVENSCSYEGKLSGLPTVILQVKDLKNGRIYSWL